MVLNKVSMRASDDSIVTLECHDRLASTAKLAREYAANGYPDRYAVVSEFDDERGADKRGIYLSCILRPSFFPSQAPLLTALAAVSFVTALEEHTQKRLGIGWVSSTRNLIPSNPSSEASPSHHKITSRFRSTPSILTSLFLIAVR